MRYNTVVTKNSSYIFFGSGRNTVPVRGLGIPAGKPESRLPCMDKQPANIHWLQNNNKSPQRQQNQLGPGNRPNGQTPQRGPGINRWLLIIVLVMLGIYAYSYLNPANNSNTSNRDELTYSDYYTQINDGNIKTAVFNGQ